MSDNKDLGTTARRLAKVGVAVGGVAARVAGEKYLGLKFDKLVHATDLKEACLLYTSPSPRDTERSRMPSSA